VLLGVVSCYWELDSSTGKLVKPKLALLKTLQKELAENLPCSCCWVFGLLALDFCGNRLQHPCISGFLTFIQGLGLVCLCGLLFYPKLLFLDSGLYIGKHSGVAALEECRLSLGFFL